MKKRIFSMLLVVCMVFTLFPTAAFAADGSAPIGASDVTDSGTPVPECNCTVQCAAADAENEIEADINPDCPVCGAEGADLAHCKGEAPVLLEALRAAGDPCTCKFKCENGGLKTSNCLYCNSGFSNSCKGCSCKSAAGLCTAAGDNTTCPVCKESDGWENCTIVYGLVRDKPNSPFVTIGTLTTGGKLLIEGTQNYEGSSIWDKSKEKIKTAHFGESMTKIPMNFFNGCTALTSVTADDPITEIGTFAFGSCSQLTSLPSLADVTNIDSNAFNGCAALKSITLPDIDNIASHTFAGCTSLTSIAIPASVKVLDDSAFKGCTSLETVTFAKGTKLETIGSDAFDGCSALTEITIPATVKNLKGNAFAGCTALETVNFAGNAPELYDPIANLFKDCSNVAIHVPAGATGYNAGAIAKAESGDTIQLQTDSMENVTTPENDYDYTIDLNSNTLSSNTENTVVHKSSGTLTIMDSGTGGTVKNTTASTGDISTITNQKNGTITIKSGTISASNTNGRAFGIYTPATTGSLNIVGDAKVTASSSSIAIAIDGSGTTTISDNASVTSTQGKISIPSGSPVIKGGSSAMSKAPDLTGYNNVKVTASNNVSGTPVVAYNPTDITSYKYLTFGTPVLPTVTDVTVTPTTATVQKGKTQQFSAVVTGTNSPAQTVTWTVTGGIAGTSINSSALLTVAASETATTLTIKVTSTVDINKSGTATVTVTTKPVTTHTVTFDANGGSVSPASATTATDGKLATLPTPTRSDYRFDGWFTAASGGTAVTTATVFTANTTLHARWTYTGGGGSTGGDSSYGGSNVIVTPPAPDQPNDPTKAEIKIDTKVDDKGGATVSITDKNITDAIEKGVAEAKKNGDEANGITLVLRADTGNKAVNTVTVNLPKTVQEKVISNKIVSTIVVVDNPNIKIGMDLNAITEINKQAKADVNLTATKLDSDKLTGEAKTAIGTRPVFDLGVSYGSKSVSNFGGGSVTVSIPYTLQAGEKADNVYGVYVDANGKAEWIENSSYDSTAKALHFSTNHFSTYGVGYKEDITEVTDKADAPTASDVPAFTDVTDHWAKADIEFVVSKGLLYGTSNTTFSPNTAMSRGMFVTALGRMAGIDTNSYKTSKFTDVKADAYYAPYVNWAASKGITAGMTATTFAPDQTVTRQEMAALMANYAKTMGYTVPKTRTEVSFADNASIGSWASDAVKSMQMAGVIMGKDGNRFDPTGTANRAEVSAVLHRYVELVIDHTMAQGLDVNDSTKIV